MRYGIYCPVAALLQSVCFGNDVFCDIRTIYNYIVHDYTLYYFMLFLFSYFDRLPVRVGGYSLNNVPEHLIIR